MLILPAIDLQGGEAVRLVKGDYNQKTVYSPDPAAVARGFADMGATYLHVVDLDGAKEGATVNLAAIRAVRKAFPGKMQLGGGIRTAETVALYIEDVGIDRVILGTAAVVQPAFVRDMLAKYGAESIVAGVDVRGGKVSTAGWLEDSGVDYLPFLADLYAMGVRYTVVTDISRDGTLTSPNWDLYESIAGLGLHVIVSGGVANESHIAQAAPYYGVIVGKAHYEGKVDLQACLTKYQNVK